MFVELKCYCQCSLQAQCHHTHQTSIAAERTNTTQLQATMGTVSSKDKHLDAPSTSNGQHDDAAARSSCPVPEGYRNPAIYNVYSQRINDPYAQSTPNPLAALQGSDLLDPKNNMPLEANQQPCPGQRKPLSTERVQSTIPKGGTEATWLYPSPQMFFNGKVVTQQQQQQQQHHQQQKKQHGAAWNSCS
jgi:hypothetical protein